MAYSLRSIFTKSTPLKRQLNHSLFSLLRWGDSESKNFHSQRNAFVASRFTFHGKFDLLGNNRRLRDNGIAATSSHILMCFMSTEVGSGVGIDGTTCESGVGEVAAAAADSFFPVAMLQHFIGSVHVYTGFDWWASIAVTTLIIRTATIPLLIKQLKATTNLTLLRPRLDDIRREIEAKDMDPLAIAEGQKKMKSLFKECGVSPFTPFIGACIQGPIFISFFYAISNMVDKVPSFKHGGAFWFVDLTTPDNWYIFPALTTLSILTTVECNAQEGLEGNPIAAKMKNAFRVFAIAAAPLTMSFPKALFCYWITSNLFSLGYGLALKIPGVKKKLGVPQVLPPSSKC